MRRFLSIHKNIPFNSCLKAARHLLFMKKKKIWKNLSFLFLLCWNHYRDIALLPQVVSLLSVREIIVNSVRYTCGIDTATKDIIFFSLIVLSCILALLKITLSWFSNCWKLKDFAIFSFFGTDWSWICWKLLLDLKFFA